MDMTQWADEERQNKPLKNYDTKEKAPSRRKAVRVLVFTAGYQGDGCLWVKGLSVNSYCAAQKS